MSVVLPLPPITGRRLATQIRGAVFGGNYTRYVQFMKIALPGLAILLLGVVVLWAKLAAQSDGFRVGYAAITQESVKNLKMVNARYFGVDHADHPYSVTADEGLQRPENSDLVDLQAPKADFVTHSGAGIVVTADHGVYHQHAQLLDLSGNVSLYHDNGYELHTEAATIDVKASTANGDVAVEGYGPQGRMNGTGFRITDRGEHITVLGHAQASLPGASGSKNRGDRP
jgi:lipopolysaccharide export system protein LptC